MAALFTKEELEAYLQRRHDDSPPDGVPDDPSTGIPQATYDVVQRMVSAWLLDATKLDTLHESSDLVWSWAIELAALAVENPVSTTQQTTLSITKQWSTADAQRRAAILARAHAWARENTELPEDRAAPMGTFDAPSPLPSDLTVSHGHRPHWRYW